MSGFVSAWEDDGFSSLKREIWRIKANGSHLVASRGGVENKRVGVGAVMEGQTTTLARFQHPRSPSSSPSPSRRVVSSPDVRRPDSLHAYEVRSGVNARC